MKILGIQILTTNISYKELNNNFMKKLQLFISKIVECGVYSTIIDFIFTDSKKEIECIQKIIEKLSEKYKIKYKRNKYEILYFCHNRCALFFHLKAFNDENGRKDLPTYTFALVDKDSSEIIIFYPYSTSYSIKKILRIYKKYKVKRYNDHNILIKMLEQ